MMISHDGAFVAIPFSRGPKNRFKVVVIVYIAVVSPGAIAAPPPVSLRAPRIFARSSETELGMFWSVLICLFEKKKKKEMRIKKL